MLPRLKLWFELAIGDPSAARADAAPPEDLSSFMDDDKLTVSESTCTEFSRAIAAFDRQQGSQAA